MAWKECDRVSQREEFVALARVGQLNFSELCRRFAVSRKTGYLWLARDRAGETMADRSRRPGHSPKQTPPEVEQAVLSVRSKHPRWGGRKIRRRLVDLGHQRVPAASTITEILRRRGLIDATESVKHAPWRRFEHAQPNDLWQMDYKGHVPMRDGRRCHPLTMLDDHSRYALELGACLNEQHLTVRDRLALVFQRYGLPQRILSDNGPPWGVPYAGEREIGLTQLGVWLILLDVKLVHGRPRHPQTQGKEERFHRTLKTELLGDQLLADQQDAQCQFDAFRQMYNHERPHEALGLDTPVQWYQPSTRSMPTKLPEIEYDEAIVRRVQSDGRFCFQGRTLRLSRALGGQPIALRPTQEDGLWEVLFYRQVIATLDQRIGDGVCLAYGRCAPSSEAHADTDV